jgi:hypothetical protein
MRPCAPEWMKRVRMWCGRHGGRCCLVERTWDKYEREMGAIKALEARGKKNMSMTVAKLSYWFEDATKVLLRVDNKSTDELYTWSSWNCTASIGLEPPFEQFNVVMLEVPPGETVYDTQMIHAKYNPDMKVNCRAEDVQGKAK